MRITKSIPLYFALLAGFAVASSPLEAQSASDLAGAWIVTSWTSPDGAVNENAQRGVFLLAITREDGGSYSMMFVPGDEARPGYAGDQQTDEEKLRAYDSFTANTGRLTVQGNELTYEAFVAKDPNYMASFVENGETATWEVDESTLTLKFTSGFMAGVTTTFRRPSSGE
jgi:hypothetical protein